MGSYTI